MGRDEVLKHEIQPEEDAELERLFRNSSASLHDEAQFINALLKKFGITGVADDDIRKSLGSRDVENMQRITVRSNGRITDFTIIDKKPKFEPSEFALAFEGFTAEQWTRLHPRSKEKMFSVTDAASWGALRIAMGPIAIVNSIRDGLIQGNASFITSRAIDHMFALRPKGHNWVGH